MSGLICVYNIVHRSRNKNANNLTQKAPYEQRYVQCTLKPWYNEQVSQTLFVHYNEYFNISNVICLVNPKNGSWVLFTIWQNSLYWGLLYRGSLYQGLSVYCGMRSKMSVWKENLSQNLDLPMQKKCYIILVFGNWT